MKLTKEQKDEIVSIAYTHVASELSLRYNCSKSQIIKIWRENGIDKNNIRFQYHFNENYFKNIDTEQKSYLLGLIAADGCAFKRSGHQGMMRLSLKKSDIHILEEIKEELQSTHPINILKKRDGKEYCSIDIVSEIFYQDLISIGIMQRKTWNLKLDVILKNIPTKFYRDFIRGYFDGNGSITETENRNPSDIYISIDCAYDFLSEIKNMLENEGLQCTIRLDDIKYTHPFGTLYFNGTPNKYLFLKYIYDNSQIKLQRKYQRYLDFIDKVESNQTNRSGNKNAINQYLDFKNNN